MSLKDKRVKSEYRSLIDNVVQDFIFLCSVRRHHISVLWGSFRLHLLLRYQRNN